MQNKQISRITQLPIQRKHLYVSISGKSSHSKWRNDWLSWFDSAIGIVEYQEIFEPFRIHMYSEKTINDLINKNNFIIKEKIADSKNSIIKHYILKK